MAVPAKPVVVSRLRALVSRSRRTSAEHLTDHRVRLIFIVGALSAFGPLSTDLYLPGIPSLARNLHATASEAQLTLTACFVGLGLGQLVAGALSDKFGRRGPLLVGLVGFTITSLLCAASPSILILIILRVLQGVAASAGIAIARAIVRDLHSGIEAAKFFSLLMLVTGIAPILSPVIGAQLLRISSWRATFIFLVFVGVMLFATVAVGLRETLPRELRRGDALKSSVTFMRSALHDRLFIGYAVTSGLATAALLTYIAGSPFVIEDIYNVSPQLFSLIFACNAGGLVIVSQINRRILGRFSPEFLLTFGAAMSALAGISLFAVAAVDVHEIWAILPLFFVIVSSVGVITPNATALAMTHYPRQAGSASAVLGVVQFGLAGLAAPLAGISGAKTALPLSTILAVLGVLAIGSLILSARREAAGPPNDSRAIAVQGLPAELARSQKRLGGELSG